VSATGVGLVRTSGESQPIGWCCVGPDTVHTLLAVRQVLACFRTTQSLDGVDGLVELLLLKLSQCVMATDVRARQRVILIAIDASDYAKDAFDCTYTTLLH